VCAFSILDVVLDAAPRAFPPAALLFGIPAEAGTADVAVVGLFGLGGACGAVFQISSDCRWWVVRLWDGWCVVGFDVSEKCSVERGAGSSGVGVPDMSMMVVWFCLGYIRWDCFIYYSTKFEGRRGREKERTRGTYRRSGSGRDGHPLWGLYLHRHVLKAHTHEGSAAQHVLPDECLDVVVDVGVSVAGSSLPPIVWLVSFVWM
jgi:hypothetical protein